MKCDNVENDPMEQSLRDLYREGKISFVMDSDLYWEGFDEVLEEKLDIEDYIEETDRKLEIYFNE